MTQPDVDPVDNAWAVELLAEEFRGLMVDDLAEVDVFDEATTAAGWSRRTLTIGDPLVDDQQPVEVTERRQGLGRKPWIEYAIACVSWAFAGDLTVTDQRRDVSAVIHAVRNHLRTNPTLGGRVALATLGDQRWAETEDENGGTQLCAFTITLLVLPK